VSYEALKVKSYHTLSYAAELHAYFRKRKMKNKRERERL